MRIIVLLVASLALAACETREESKARNQKKLPDGCVIIDLDYRDLQAAVVCDGRRTTTTVRTWQTFNSVTKLMDQHQALVAVID